MYKAAGEEIDKIIYLEVTDIHRSWALAGIMRGYQPKHNLQIIFWPIRNTIYRIRDKHRINSMVYEFPSYAFPSLPALADEEKKNMNDHKLFVSVMQNMTLVPLRDDEKKLEFTKWEQNGFKKLFNISVETIQSDLPIYWGYYLLRVRRLANLITGLTDDYNELLRRLDGTNGLYSKLFMGEFFQDSTLPINTVLPKVIIDLISSYDFVRSEKPIVDRLCSWPEFSRW